MRPSRRDFLALSAQAAALMLGSNAAVAADTPLRRLGLGIVIHSYGIRRSRNQAGDFADPRVFLEYCRQLGAAGIQTSLGVMDHASAEGFRVSAESAEMYVEGIIGLPKDEADTERFADELNTAAACGAKVVRTVMLSGRRYETFADAESFRRFAKESFHRLELAKPVVERLEIQLAVENHKDWRVEEMLDILRRIDCPFVGVCLDTGNSIALLEEPHEVVDAYAPLAFTTHFKDMALKECEDGFLLSEVPLGTGYLDLARIVRSVRAKKPDIRLNLEMITRDPLRVPCLDEKYWATFSELPARRLAEAMRRVRRNATDGALPQVSDKNPDEALGFEDRNVRDSLEFAAARLSAG